MSSPYSLPEWQSSAASSMAEVLEFEEDNGFEIKDVIALAGDRVPDWLRRLGIPQGWELMPQSDEAEVPLARVAVQGPRDDGGWEATETISIFEYTGWPEFLDVLHKSAGTLRALSVANIVTKVLPVPSRRWTAAVRSSGVALIGGKPIWAPNGNAVWVQQTTFAEGSLEPHAGRLIVHSVFVDAVCRARLGADVAQLSDAVYQGFIASISAGHQPG